MVCIDFVRYGIVCHHYVNGCLCACVFLLLDNIWIVKGVQQPFFIHFTDILCATHTPRHFQHTKKQYTQQSMLSLAHIVVNRIMIKTIHKSKNIA